MDWTSVRAFRLPAADPFGTLERHLAAMTANGPVILVTAWLDAPRLLQALGPGAESDRLFVVDATGEDGALPPRTHRVASPAHLDSIALRLSRIVRTQVPGPSTIILLTLDRLIAHAGQPAVEQFLQLVVRSVARPGSHVDAVLEGLPSPAVEELLAANHAIEISPAVTPMRRVQMLQH